MVSLIFGAGASFGSGGCHPNNPPLGNDLFKELEKIGGAFSMLDAVTKLAFEKDGFEAGMAMIADDSRAINPLKKELACYLTSFSVKPDNAYVRLFNKLQSCLSQVNVTTLNYDLLIEQSLSKNALNIDYNAENKGVHLLKLHGSSNFLPHLPNGITVSGNTMIGVDTFFEGLETKAVSTAEEVKLWCNDPKNSDLSPVLAMYAKGKRVVINKKLTEKIQEKYSEMVASSRLVVLVGIKYIPHDAHIWRPIEQSHTKLLIVDPFPESTIAWVQANNFENVTVLKKSFENAVWDITKAVHRELI